MESHFKTKHLVLQHENLFLLVGKTLTLYNTWDFTHA
jgi:hypothetical protein